MVDAARERDDRAAFEAVRRRAPNATEAFIRRFHQLLLPLARALGVPPDEQVGVVAETLVDVAVKLAKKGDRPAERRVRSVRAYLKQCLRNHVIELRRHESAQRRCGEELAAEGAAHHEGAVGPLCSHAAVRESEGPGWERDPPTAAMRGLNDALWTGLTPEDAALLHAVNYGESRKDIGKRLGATEVSVRVRIHRLRERLFRLATEHAAEGAAHNEAGFEEVLRFLRRTGAFDAEVLRQLRVVRGGSSYPSQGERPGGRRRAARITPTRRGDGDEHATRERPEEHDT